MIHFGDFLPKILLFLVLFSSMSMPDALFSSILYLRLLIVDPPTLH